MDKADEVVVFPADEAADGSANSDKVMFLRFRAFAWIVLAFFSRLTRCALEADTTITDELEGSRKPTRTDFLSICLHISHLSECLFVCLFSVACYLSD